MTNRTDAIKLAIEALERNKRGLENLELFGKSNVKFSGLTEMIEKTGAALAALQAPNWSDIGRLIEAANGAAARGFISGTSNWAAFVSRAMGGQAREGVAVANSAILARGRFHAFKGEDGEPDDWEWFEEGTNCEHGCIDAVIVRARNFPNFPIGYHIPEVFAAVGETPPEPTYEAEQVGKYICPVRTVADLVNNLKLMDQTLPIYGAQYIEHLGKSRCIATPPTVSRERIKDSRWIGEGDTLNAAVIWTRAEQPPQPAAQEQAREGEAVAWSDDALNRAYSDGVAYGERNYRQAIATYQAEASGYKDAYFKLVEGIANLKVFEPAPPIIIAAPQAAQPSEPAQPEQGPST